MVDSKTVINQVQELQIMLHDIHAEGMQICETFQVASIIEKLPPVWVDFKNYLKHKRKEMSIEDLIVRLRIEEDNKLAQKKDYVPTSEKANVVEHGQSSVKNKFVKGKNQKKGKGTNFGPKAGTFKKKKFQGNCYNCDRPGHRSANCKLPKKEKATEVNAVEEITRDVSDMVLVAVILEVNLVD
jgi:hypothetical protein